MGKVEVVGERSTQRAGVPSRPGDEAVGRMSNAVAIVPCSGPVTTSTRSRHSAVPLA